MNTEKKKSSKVTVVASDTRTWTSGHVKFAVRSVEGHPESNYVTMEKHLLGKPLSGGSQKFILNLRDWPNLKRLIEVELAEKHQWVLQGSEVVLLQGQRKEEIAKLIQEHPELIERILEAPDLKSLSNSFEYLNRLAMKVSEVQSKNLDIVLKNLTKASPNEFIQFASLLADLRLGQIASLANLVRQKLEMINLFEKLTTEQKTREKEIHQLIEDNPWIAHKNYEVLSSDRPMTDYLSKHAKDDPELKTRPDLIIKRVPFHDQIVLIELKRPSVKLTSAHIGQVLGYRDLIKQYKPGTKSVDCYVFGYEKQYASLESNDVTIRTFSELAASLRDEYQAYLKVLEENSNTADSDDLPIAEDEESPF